MKDAGTDSDWSKSLDHASIADGPVGMPIATLTNLVNVRQSALDVIRGSRTFHWSEERMLGVWGFEAELGLSLIASADRPDLLSALSAQSAYLSAMSIDSDSGGGRMADVSEALVSRVLGLSCEQVLQAWSSIDPSRARRIRNIARFLETEGVPAALTSGQGWFQHQVPTLSSLDMEMIRYVPQGGNWQDIPEAVPSKRLEQIREMTRNRGVVRTTYYGRLRPDQPAYTIATYYNRPGNGTNIHPWEDRTLTSREAARLQSFPDWYVFLGSEGAVRMQIGNAVPPLLAYALGSQIAEYSEELTCVDLFAGAGGLSLGLEEAGWEIVVAADNNPWAVETYRFNRPSHISGTAKGVGTEVTTSDLGDAGQRNQLSAGIRDRLAGRTLGLLAGGPPCQGFSHAGWRSQSDARNDLAAAFMTLVEDLEPRLVVMENVEGLLTYNKGQVVRDLLATLHELGYDTGDSPWVLEAERYGVPQMRRRVFIVGNRDGLPIQRPTPILQKCFGRREAAARASLFDHPLPYPVTVAESLLGLPPLSPRTHPSLGSRPVRTSFSEWAGDRLSTAELVERLSREF